MEGAVLGSLTSGNAVAGAIGEGGSAAMASGLSTALYGTDDTSKLKENEKQNLSAAVQIATGLAAGTVGALSGENSVSTAMAMAQGAESGKNEVENNFLSDHSKAVLNDSRKKVHSHNGTPKDDQIVISKSYEDQRSDELAAKYRNGTATPEEEQELNGYLKEYVSEQLQSEKYTPDQVIQQVDDILSGTPVLQSSNDVPYYPYALSEEDKDQASDAIKNAEIWDTDASLPSKILTRLLWSRPQSFNEQAYHDAQGGLERYDAQQSQANIGTPAIYFLGGGVGTAVRAIAAGLSGYQYGTGANQILNGDTANGLLDTTLGGLGMIGAAGGEGLVNGIKGDSLTSIAAKDNLNQTLYRAVKPSELEDILETGQFRIKEGVSVEGKYFTTSSEKASDFARQAVQNLGDPPYTTVSTQIRKNELEKISPVSVDGGIPAYVIPPEGLPKLIPLIHSSMVLPKK